MNASYFNFKIDLSFKCDSTLICIFFFLPHRKARRKEKDAVAASQEESKLYLEQAVLECTVPESRLREVIDLPPGLDYNEWLASHSKLSNLI